MLAPAIHESNGQRSVHTIPTVTARLNTTAAAAGGGTIVADALVVADGLGGEPGLPLRIVDPNQAKDVLIGGNLLEFVTLALRPNRFLRPSRVFAMRANPATQASLTADDGSNDVIKFSDRDFGERGNSIQMKIEDGTTEGKKTTFQRGSIVEAFNNLTFNYFDILYTGAGSAATLDITSTALTTTVTSGPGGEDLNILFSGNKTIADVISQIQANPVYTVNSIGETFKPPSDLDVLSAVDIKTGAVIIRGINAAIIENTNNQSQLVQASFESGFTKDAPANFVFTFFTGGAEGTTSAATLAPFLGATLNQPFRYLSIDSVDTAIQDAFIEHIRFANGAFGGISRRGYIGQVGGIVKATAITNAKARAKQIDDPDISFLFNGFTVANSDSVVTDFGSNARAAMEAGLKSAIPIQTPTTNKELNVLSLEHDVDRAEIEDLMDSGVAVAAFEAGTERVKVTRSITTSQTPNLIDQEDSMRSIAIFSSNQMALGIQERHLGEPLTKTRLADILADAKDFNEQFAEDGLYTGDADNPAHSGEELRVDGDKVFIKYNANVTAPFNFGFIDANLDFFRVL